MAKEAIRAELLAGMKVGARYLVSETRAAIESMTSIVVTSVLATSFKGCVHPPKLLHSA